MASAVTSSVSASAGDAALDIVAVGLDAEGHFGQVGLGGVVEELQRLRGHANRERQHSGGGRIEGTGVADPLFPQETARAATTSKLVQPAGLSITR